MKLTVFQSDKGDCLLVTSARGATILADGGMSTSYRAHVASTLSRLKKKKIDVVYVSHIDEDHISGVLQMVDDLVAWRVYEYQRKDGSSRVKKPAFPRTPEIGRIWHNAFHDAIGKNAGPITSLLAAMSNVLEESPRVKRRNNVQQLATSVSQAIRLSRRIGDQQLGIPLNPEFEGKLMQIVETPPPLKVGDMKVSLVGPFKEDLDTLRKEWNAWLRTHVDEVARLRKKAADDEDLLANVNDVERLLEPLIAESRTLGSRAKVTAPNLASLMLLVEEGGKSMLLTGDGHWKDILRGLGHLGRLDADGKIHVGLLKVQHHGSEHNVHADFCDAVTADQYVFCGNGAHKNPDLDVVELFVKSRLAGAGPNRKFKLWFNSSPTETEVAANKEQMRKVKKLVEKLAKGTNRFTASFMGKDADSFALSV